MMGFLSFALPFILLGAIWAEMPNISHNSEHGLFPFETAAGVDFSGTAMEKDGWKARVLFHPERIGIMNGEMIDFGVIITPPKNATSLGRLRIKWAIVGGEREILMKEKVKEINTALDKVTDTNTALLNCVGIGPFWLQCLITFPDGNSITLRRPFVILDNNRRTMFTIYACAAPNLSDKPWRYGADVVADAGINLMLFNAIDDWNGEAGKRAEERLDWFACFGINWIDFPSTIDWTLIHAPIATGMWDAYHDPDVRAFCRQLTQCVAQWGRRLPSFVGISLMDEPAARSFWGNNAEVFCKNFLTYDPVAEPLRFYADYHRFNCWSMGELFRDCRDAAREVDKKLKICVEGHNNFWTGSGIYAPLNVQHLDLNTTHHYYGDYGWGQFATLLGCEMAQIGLREKPLWMMGGFGPLKQEQYRAQVGQAIARGAKAFGYFELADPNRFSKMVREIRQINRELERIGTIFNNLRRKRSNVAVLFSISNAAFFAKHPPVRLDAWKDQKALAFSLSESLKLLNGATEMFFEQGVVMHKPDERTDYGGACMAALMALTFSGYDAEFIGEEEVINGGLAGKKVIFAPQIVYLPNHVIEALTKFVKSGGLVLTDEETRLKLPIWKKLPISVVMSIPKGRFDERPYEGAAFEKMREILTEAVKSAVKPRIEGIKEGIIYGYFDGGSARYLVISNATWKYEQDNGKKLEQFDGEILASNLVSGVRVQIGKGIVGHGGETQKWRISLPPGGFAIYSFLPKRIWKISIHTPKTVRAGQSGKFSIALLDPAGKNLPIVAPIEVQISIGNGKSIVYYRATDAQGKFTGEFFAPLATNSKTIQIKVSELLTGCTASAKVPITPAKAVLDAQELGEVLISDPKEISEFFGKFFGIKIIASEQLQSIARELAERLSKVCPKVNFLVELPELARQPEKFPPSVDPEFHRKRDQNAQVHPHFNPTHLTLGGAAILIGDETNNPAIQDLLNSNLLLRRMNNELYADKAILQYAWAPFDPDADVVILRATKKEAIAKGIEVLIKLAKR